MPRSVPFRETRTCVPDGASPESFHGTDLKNRRTPDDIVHIHDEAQNQLGPGRYAVEDKTGEHAFKIDQAEDYARRSYNAGKQGGGFRQTKDSKTTVYDGLIYVFSTKDEATSAVRFMEDNAIINKVLGKEPGGIHVTWSRSRTMHRRFRACDRPRSSVRPRR